GPDVVKVTTGEEVTFETLGGADIHGQRSGVAHFVSENEDDAFSAIRTLIGYIPSSCRDDPPRVSNEDPIDRADENLQSLIPLDPTHPYEMRDVIGSITDRGEFLEVMPHH